MFNDVELLLIWLFASCVFLFWRLQGLRWASLLSFFAVVLGIVGCAHWAGESLLPLISAASLLRKEARIDPPNLINKRCIIATRVATR
jgi:hypothetical protein